MAHFGQELQVRYKAPGNPVTEVDGLTQRLIADKLRRVFPEYGFLAEESIAPSSGEIMRWIVDPMSVAIRNGFHRC